MAKKCSALKKDGSPCSAWALPNSKYCWAHSPALKAKRKAARKNGGRARHYPKDDGEHRVESLEDILEELNKLLLRAWRRDSTATNDRVLVAILGSFENLLRPSEVEERLRVIEARLGIVEVNNED